MATGRGRGRANNLAARLFRWGRAALLSLIYLVTGAVFAGLGGLLAVACVMGMLDPDDELGLAGGALFEQLGTDRDDADYVRAPEWGAVVRAARSALRALREEA